MFQSKTERQQGRESENKEHLMLLEEGQIKRSRHEWGAGGVGREESYLQSSLPPFLALRADLKVKRPLAPEHSSFLTAPGTVGPSHVGLS